MTIGNVVVASVDDGDGTVVVVISVDDDDTSNVLVVDTVVKLIFTLAVLTVGLSMLGVVGGRVGT